MCLRTTQSNYDIAEIDISVNKDLIFDGKWMTPYQCESIVFKKGIAIQEAKSFGITKGYSDIIYISEGIHSTMYPANFRAIIPKGTPYYYEVDALRPDFVSLKLIIFKNDFYYWKYKIKKFIKCFKF